MARIVFTGLGSRPAPTVAAAVADAEIQLPIMVGGQPADFGAATVAESLSWLEPTCGLT